VKHVFKTISVIQACIYGHRIAAIVVADTRIYTIQRKNLVSQIAKRRNLPEPEYSYYNLLTSSAMSTKPLVLITGATGHIGYRTLAFALQSGYQCRVTSRSLASLEKLRNLPSTAPYASDLQFTAVPDMLAPCAFDAAVKDVDYIIHLAAPIPTPDAEGKHWKEFFYDPAVQGTVGILESAAKSPSVKRVVITSSTAVVGSKEGQKAGMENLVPKINPDIDPGNARMA
jgi:nucleoside-diphosphate-sugar epimerase